MKTVYLCGPINGCTDAECNDWRSFAKEHLKCGTLDPMARDYRGREREPGIDAKIVENDKADIDESDILLVNYVKPSVGTSMEILWAWLAHKPIILVAAEGENLSPWLTYHVSKIVHSMRAACEWCDAQ
jgi:nucleoside 2-deoxyribosyltransferase